MVEPQAVVSIRKIWEQITRQEEGSGEHSSVPVTGTGVHILSWSTGESKEAKGKGTEIDG